MFTSFAASLCEINKSLEVHQDLDALVMLEETIETLKVTVIQTNNRDIVEDGLIKAEKSNVQFGILLKNLGYQEAKPNDEISIHTRNSTVSSSMKNNDPEGSEVVIPNVPVDMVDNNEMNQEQKDTDCDNKPENIRLKTGSDARSLLITPELNKENSNEKDAPITDTQETNESGIKDKMNENT